VTGNSRRIYIFLWKGYENQLFIDSIKAYDSVRWEVLYNILIELGGTHEISYDDYNVFKLNV
jgi:hypothetical protein